MTEERFTFLEPTQRVFRHIMNALEKDEISSVAFWKDLEERLELGDLSQPTSHWLIQQARQQAEEGQLVSGSQIKTLLRQKLVQLLGKPSRLYSSQQSAPIVMMVLGDSGSGKTTSVAKLAYYLKSSGLNTAALTATDLLRSSRLKMWSEQINVPIIRYHNNPDSGLSVESALKSVLASGYDVVLLDTVTYSTLEEQQYMEELKDIVHRIQQVIPGAPHEILVVADATLGQNGVAPLRKFAENTGLTGIILSKVDSTSRGGCAFAFVDDLGVPIKFLGTGEAIEQLFPFDPEDFVSVLFTTE